MLLSGPPPGVLKPTDAELISKTKKTIFVMMGFILCTYHLCDSYFSVRMHTGAQHIRLGCIREYSIISSGFPPYASEPQHLWFQLVV
jgi:hypothetical protein